MLWHAEVTKVIFRNEIGVLFKWQYNIACFVNMLFRQNTIDETFCLQLLKYFI